MKIVTLKIHALIEFFNMEELFISLSVKWTWFKKFVPLNHQYSIGTLKEVNRNDVNFKLDISDYMQWHIWADLKDDSWKLATHKKKNRQQIVIDVGANVGAFCLKVGKVFSLEKNNSKVIAFEPNPAVFNTLSCNYSLNREVKDNVVIEQLGLSDRTDSINFSWNKSNSGGGSFVPRENTITENLIEVPVISLDKYVFEKEIKRIDFIKIDVEGYEPIVLEGAKKVIAKYRPELYIEVSPKWWANAGFLVSEVLEWIEELEYKFVVYFEGKPKVVSLEELSNIEDQFDVHIIPN